jgi:5,10-methylene-tetrahydrofolate dehydrogenase/methenyl tetrahydrofolate cyclohydrolase
LFPFNSFNSNSRTESQTPCLIAVYLILIELAMSSQGPHLPLQGKSAIVTGASRGIGAGIAFELGKRGADVLCSPL